jgi:hypothetical protein
LFYLGFFGHSFCERPRAVVFYRVFLRVPTVGPACWRRKLMNGYISQRRGRFYVVIYEGRDPVTGKELWRWHPAGSDRAEAERLAKKLTVEETRRVEAIRSLTFGAYLTSQWLPAKKLHLATSTYKRYERNVVRHVLPVLGRTGLRRLRYQQIESLYDAFLHPNEGKGCHRRRCTRSIYSSAAPSPTPSVVGW